MRIESFQYVKPRTLSEACAMLQEQGAGAKLLAGGTDFLVALKQQRVGPGVVVDIRGLTEAGHLAVGDDNSIRIGSLVTLDRVADSEQINTSFALLSEAARSVGAVQHRTMGTVGGNVCLDTRCWFFNQSSSWRKSRPVCIKLGGDICHVVNRGGVCWAAFSADLATALAAVDAEVVLQSSGGERSLPLEEFYTGDGAHPHALRPDEIVREIRVAATPYRVKSCYLKRRVRGALDFGMAGVALSLWLDKNSGKIKKARVLLSSLGTRPLRVPEAEELLLTGEINESTLSEIGKSASRAAKPVKNVFGATVTYRREMAGVLVEEGIRRLLTPFERGKCDSPGDKGVKR